MGRQAVMRKRTWADFFCWWFGFTLAGVLSGRILQWLFFPVLKLRALCLGPFRAAWGREIALQIITCQPRQAA